MLEQFGGATPVRLDIRWVIRAKYEKLSKDEQGVGVPTTGGTLIQLHGAHAVATHAVAIEEKVGEGGHCTDAVKQLDVALMAVDELTRGRRDVMPAVWRVDGHDDGGGGAVKTSARPKLGDVREEEEEEAERTSAAAEKRNNKVGVQRGALLARQP
ncbi:hypothetical protein FGB62_223g020 [Gracilaria domingensis]|nr:hypothetical protein FGB62_223g020 [Gracilaria domingensis]